MWGTAGGSLGFSWFALPLHMIVERIAEEVSVLQLKAWCLDNGTICGYKEDLLKALSIIEVEGPSRGIVLNQSKSLLFVHLIQIHPIILFRLMFLLPEMALFYSELQLVSLHSVLHMLWRG